ncbi:glycosyltransferase [Candidatus Woesebacteria bacterium]|nr:glycosyltransferase [Candidatus Woesebacteria bacterium]
MKTVGLYSPYIPKHAGGGERYLLSIAEVCSQYHSTYLLVPADLVVETQRALPRYSKMFGLDLSAVKVKASLIGISKSPITTVKETQAFHYLFAMTDGSIFPTLCRNSYLIMQVPWKRPLKVTERAKLISWKKILVYSDFVAKVLSQSWHVRKLEVLAPYVDHKDFVAGKKEKLIVTTGRFFAHSQSNSKHQDVLIQAFIKWIDQDHPKGWHFAVVGNVDPNPDSHDYVSKLKELSRGYPISLHLNVSFDELRAFYARAQFYWHAAGFNVDEKKHPENTEHFGITTVEAMASGAIPIVVPKGGQVEVVGDPQLYWNSPQELVDAMRKLVKQSSAQRDDLLEKLLLQSKRYSKENFERSLKKLLNL